VDDKQHIFQIQIAEGEYIAIKTFKDFVSIALAKSNPTHYFDSVGLMGQYGSSKTENSMFARDGQTILLNANEFGQEWQVTDKESKLFHHVERYPQFPQDCILPDQNVKEARRRLGERISKDAAEKACAHWDDDHRPHCIFDVMATGDFEMAELGGAF